MVVSLLEFIPVDMLDVGIGNGWMLVLAMLTI